MAAALVSSLRRGAHEEVVAFLLNDTVSGHRLQQPDVAADDCVRTDARVAAEDGGVGVNGDVVLDIGVAFHAFDRVAVVIHLEGFGTEGHALVNFDVIADGAGFADNYAGGVIDEKMSADEGAWVNVGAGALVGVLREHAGQERDPEFVEYVRETLNRDRQHARIGEDDFLDAARGGIPLVSGGDVGLDDAAQLRETPERFGRESGGTRRRFGLAGEAQAFFEFGGEALFETGEESVDVGGHGVFLERGRFEIAREKQVHVIAGKRVDRFLRR